MLSCSTKLMWWCRRWSVCTVVLGTILALSSCMRPRHRQHCAADQIFTNCTTEPCAITASGFDALTQCTGGKEGKETANSGLENVTCTNDYCGGCFARYYSTDGAEISCDSKIVTLCEGDSPLNISCADNLKIKMWYALMRTENWRSVCPHLNRSADSAYCTHSVLYQAAKLCDGAQYCLLSVNDIREKLDLCQPSRNTYVQLDYSCYGTESSSPSQVRFFTMGLLVIGSLFPLSLLMLLITVQIKKHYRDAYAMSSLHLPLTDNENPEL